MFATMRDAGFSILATIQPPDKNAATVARKERGIASTANLKGQKVGVAPGTTGDYSLESALVMNGMAWQDV
jgi:ABC-type nitrate/sulfonate/bicarbonate transport system substrate-binding protein